LLIAAILSFAKPWGTVRHNPVKKAATTELGRSMVVEHVHRLTPGVITLRLTAADGSEPPAWEPGAHIALVLAPAAVRPYSLHRVPADRRGYAIAGLKGPEGRGGSIEIHKLEPGHPVMIKGSRNNFPLHDAPAY